MIVTADHGEQLGEHDIWFHHHHLYDESLQVPLILRAPGRTMEQPRVDAQVRLMDVAPTIMDWVGLERMNPSEGVSLLEFAEGKRQASLSTTLYGRRSASLSEGTLFGARVAANFGEDLVDIKYILDPATGEEELYNLFTDRAEAENIAGTQPESLEALRDVVRQEVGAASGLAAQVDDASVEKLRALGYIE